MDFWRHNSGALPPGWVSLRHSQYEQPCWLHTQTRVVTWMPPYLIDDTSLATEHLAPAAHLLATKQMEDLSRGEQQASNQQQLKSDPEVTVTVEESLARQLSAPSSALLTYGEFLREMVNGREMVSRQSNAQVPAIFVRAYSASVIGARPEAVVDVPADGPWLQPPHRCRVSILGVVVAEARHSVRETVRALAFEEAAFTLAPQAYAEQLRRLNLKTPRVLKPVITDAAVLETLSVDDEDSILDLDLCVARTAPMMLAEHLLRTYGTVLPSSETTREAVQEVEAPSGHQGAELGASPLGAGTSTGAAGTSTGAAGTSTGRRRVRGFEHSITVGGRVHAAFDVSARRARARACIRLLSADHPQARSWGEIVRLFPADGEAPKIAARSQAAETLLRQDQLTLPSLNMQARDRKFLERGVCEPAHRDGGGGGINLGGGGGLGSGCRLPPGSGQHFHTSWQRQAELEQARRVAISEGHKIENDTRFAFAFDRERERADATKLQALRVSVQELGAAELTEQLRDNEPLSIRSDNIISWHALEPGSTGGVPGVATSPAGSGGDGIGRALEWAPWRPGTRTYKRLREIAAQAAADPALPSAAHHTSSAKRPSSW